MIHAFLVMPGLYIAAFFELIKELMSFVQISI